MDNERNDNKSTKAMRFWFGIFMVLFYVGVGVLLIVANQTFQMFNSPKLALAMGIVFCIYGLFRGYRLYKGMD
jgi:putative flippase GtrA